MPTNASPRLRERERLPRGQEARWIERGALDLLYSTAQAGSGDPTEQAGWLAGWLAGLAGLDAWLFLYYWLGISIIKYPKFGTLIKFYLRFPGLPNL